jgi:josephin
MYNNDNTVGLGNYDVNIIMAALQRIGLDTIWFDKRRYFLNQLVLVLS